MRERLGSSVGSKFPRMEPIFGIAVLTLSNAKIVIIPSGNSHPERVWNSILMTLTGKLLRPLLVFCWLGFSGCQHSADRGLHITHGPILGRVESDGVGIWARTSAPGTFQVRYGLRPQLLSFVSESVGTQLAHDNTAWLQLKHLKSDTKYFYEVYAGETSHSSNKRTGSFRTLPNSESFRHAQTNPQGLFNYRFEFGCGNNQSHGQTPAQESSVFETMLRNLKDKIHFAILNGDWIYEERRDYSVQDWMANLRIGPGEMPTVLELVPNLVGVWENYKVYLERSKNLAAWHREIPSYFVFDDHEIVDDVTGTGSVGFRNRRAVFRDIGVRAWYDYLGWANPISYQQDIYFGRTSVEAGKDVLFDPQADFSHLKLDEAANLHIHWGGREAGQKGKSLDSVGGDPNAGVYEIPEILDKNRIRIRPSPVQSGVSSYSIGRLSYWRRRIANTEFFFLDTRSHRQSADTNQPNQPGVSMLGKRQKSWLMEAMTQSDADFFFVVSSVNLMIPHIVDVGQADFANYHDSWTAFLQEREELIRFWDSLDSPVFVLTGDLHNSFVVKITENVWEFAGGPHTSGNSIAASEGDHPPNGVFDYRGRKCTILWSSYMMNDTSRDGFRVPVYCVVQVNNVFNNPDPQRKDRWVAFPYPQIVFQYYHGLSGDLLYAHSVLARKSTIPIQVRINKGT